MDLMEPMFEPRVIGRTVTHGTLVAVSPDAFPMTTGSSIYPYFHNPSTSDQEQGRVGIAGTMHERASSLSESSRASVDRSMMYRDLSTVIVVPTRGMIPIEVALNWMVMALPVNQMCAGWISERGKEVGAAYELLFSKCIDEDVARAWFGAYAPNMLRAKFVVTLEDDVIPEPDAITKLLACIHTCPDCGGEVSGGEWDCADGHRGYDGVSGLYYQKCDPPIPMAYGDPDTPGDFRPVFVGDAIRNEQLIEVNGIAMGISVWRKEAFAHISRPWFQTTNTATQDIFFCKKAKDEYGSRFGVACFVKAGHLDASTGAIT